jgi:glyoxylase-like metal-dependent hydrolase (beta-lactamase superfamily II)
VAEPFFFLTCGRLIAPAWLMCPGARGSVDLPLTVGVVPRGDGRHVLVDCGFAGPEMTQPFRHLGPWGAMYRFREHRTIAEQLAARGIAPASVSHIVATHLHLDHIGGFVDFPHAELLATQAEIHSVMSRGQFAGYHHGKALAKSGRLVPLALESGERHGFPAHHDLLGDGRVVVLEAHGHTAGSVAVLLTDGRRSILHAGDAAYDPVEYREGRQSVLSKVTAFRKEWLQATWGRLRDYEAAGGDVLLAHDPRGFARVAGAT